MKAEIIGDTYACFRGVQLPQGTHEKDLGNLIERARDRWPGCAFQFLLMEPMIAVASQKNQILFKEATAWLVEELKEL